MNWFNDLQARGAVFDVTDPEIAQKLTPQDSFYVGVDPTAPYLQLGNLIALITIARIAKGGIKPIILFGGATGAIGDPSGKSSERTLLEQETLLKNMETQKKAATTLFERLGCNPSFVDNATWTKDVTILEFLRDIGKYFTVNYMTAKDSVKSRLEGDGISFTEFTYMLLQAFDFYHLYKTENCRLQIGGSDQWGNMTAGLELIRKKAGGQAFSLCWPLLTDSAGKKFGKSEGGAIWLDSRGTSPYKLHQFLLNTADEDAVRFTKLLSMKPLEDIEKLEKEFRASPEQRLMQNELADSICTLVHDSTATAEAKKAADILFKGGDLSSLPDSLLKEALNEVPNVEITRNELQTLQLQDLFIKAGAINSKGEAKRLIASGGAYIHGERLSDGATLVSSTQFANKSLLVLRTGKKNYYLISIK